MLLKTLLCAREDGENNIMKITLATGNIHKVEEINLISKPYNIEFVLPKSEFNPVEDGSNFLENAYCKALCASKTGETELYLADDSGLCVDILNGAPGLKSARYAPTADERIDKLLNALKDFPDIKDRTAHFTCAMVVVDKNGKIVFEVQKDCPGYIMKERKGVEGFGYDPIFFVNSKNKGMAELTPDEKAIVSHRAQSLNSVLNWLKNK